MTYSFYNTRKASESEITAPREQGPAQRQPFQPRLKDTNFVRPSLHPPSLPPTRHTPSGSTPSSKGTAHTSAAKYAPPMTARTTKGPWHRSSSTTTPQDPNPNGDSLQPTAKSIKNPPFQHPLGRQYGQPDGPGCSGGGHRVLERGTAA